MLVNFRVENFKSLKNNTQFSMQATKLKNLTESNTFLFNNISLLKSAVIYGANASGKSNVLSALENMKQVVKNSMNIEKIKQYPLQTYLLSTESEKKDTTFEIEIIIDETIYRYGFSIYEKGIIHNEWLEQKKMIPRAKWNNLFNRKKQNITLGNLFSEGKLLKDKTRDNALFLSVVAQFNGEKSQSILQWFNSLKILSNIKNEEFEHYSFKMLEEENFKDRIVSFIKSADTGISNIKNKKIKLDDLKLGKKELDQLPDFILNELKEKGLSSIETLHIQYDEDNSFKAFKAFPLDFESTGTRKLLALSAHIIDTLDEGGILIVDELDNSMHTDLVESIIKLFNSKITNPNNAQLIFTTHDTNLLKQENFRRDQIWFTQKDIFGATELYSLVEYGKGKTRDDLVLEKNYLNGKFGGKPHISSLVYKSK